MLSEGFDISSLDPQVAAILGEVPMMAPHQEDELIFVRRVHTLSRNRQREIRQFAAGAATRRKPCDRLDEHSGKIRAEQFGPVRLKSFRATRVDEGLDRRYINRLVRMEITLFKHAVAGELIDVSTVERPKTLEPTQTLLARP